MKRALPAVTLGYLLAGCAPSTEAYPSLAPRRVEGRGFAEPSVPAAPAAAPDPQLDALVAARQRDLAGLQERFATARTEAARLVAAAGAARAGEDRWLDAQSALAVLDSQRAETNTLLAELDEAVSARGAALAAPYPALEALRTDAAGAAEKQAAAITELAGRLAPA